MKLRRQAGVTLIEILIAVSLLSLLSVGVLVAMRIALNTMDKTDAHLVRNRRVSNSEKLLENQLAGFMVTKAEWRPAPDRAEILPFMQFEPQTMRFVTAYSLQDAWRGRAQIVAFQVIPGERGVGVRLIVNELPYAGPAQTGLMVTGTEPNPLTGGTSVHFAPVLPGPQSFVLADRLAYCRFLYQEPRPEPPFRLWRPDWLLPNKLPLGIRIEMAPLESAASEVQVTTVTVPMRLTRDTVTFYADGY
ncbi:MAG TPA: prepilin-type N-terminal cleavage/methylation domain-containing protein [Bryobacteraceae bacterium]|nr:prepilin-type N-terminal cleavage/methylation domain-containing protein [Bryobacteraceae bacterium]